MNSKSLISRLMVFTVSLVSLPLVAQSPVGFGHAELFDDGWEFSSDSLVWHPVTLPHDWSIEGTPSPDLASCTGYLPGGMGWYRKTFTLPVPADALAFICFDGVYNRSTVWLNGSFLGYRPNGYVSFCYEMTPYLRREGENRLMVRVDHSRSADSRWYTGSGIWRDVWLVTSAPTHLAQWGTTYTYRADEGVLDVCADLVADARQRHLTLSATLTDAQSQVVAEQQVPVSVRRGADGSEVRLSLPVSEPQLWDIDRPYLYRLHLALLNDGVPVDTATLRVGLRTLRFDADEGFFLNGVNRKVKGVCVHHDAGVLGAAVPREVWQRRLLALRDMGANAIRCSHNPQNPDLYDLCDELGLLVIDEASDEWEYPKRKWLKGWNKGDPGYEGSFDFFNEWIERDVADMVRRDRNHPSVFLWSIGNEVDYPNDPYSHPVLDGTSISQPMYGGYKPDAPRAERIGEIAQTLSAVVRQLDATRPVTGALAGVVMSNETAYPSAVDVVGYNYTESRYVTDHELYPQRIIYGSETGTGFNEWKAVRDNAHIFGQFVWTGLDYLGESGAWPSRGLGTGLIDYAGYPKPRGMFRRALWSEQPVAYIGTYPERMPRGWGARGAQQRQQSRRPLSMDAPDVWNYTEGDSVRVVCYTNAPQARLLLNGAEVGALQPYDDVSGIISWCIPYVPGTLVCEACDADGRVVATHALHTYGKAVALRTTVVQRTDRFAQVLVEAVDADGNRVRDFMQPVQTTVTPDVRLLGVENALGFDMTAPQSPTKMMGSGRLLTYIALPSSTTAAPSSTSSTTVTPAVTFTTDTLPPATQPL